MTKQYKNMCILNNSTATKQWTFILRISRIVFQMILSPPAYRQKETPLKKKNTSFSFVGEQMEKTAKSNKINPVSMLCLKVKHWIWWWFWSLQRFRKGSGFRKFRWVKNHQKIDMCLVSIYSHTYKHPKNASIINWKWKGLHINLSPKEMETKGWRREQWGTEWRREA